MTKSNTVFLRWRFIHALEEESALRMNQKRPFCFFALCPLAILNFWKVVSDLISTQRLECYFSRGLATRMLFCLWILILVLNFSSDLKPDGLWEARSPSSLKRFRWFLIFWVALILISSYLGFPQVLESFMLLRSVTQSSVQRCS